MTANERACFNALITAVGADFHVFPQIHLSAFLDNKITGQSWRVAFFHINQKSVDFMLCNKTEIAPILAIELDDKAHERPDRQERNREVERILKDASIPLLRINNRNVSDVQELTTSIQNSIKQA